MSQCYGCDRTIYDEPNCYMVDGECNDCAGEGLCLTCGETIYDDEYNRDVCTDCGRSNPEQRVCEDCLDLMECEICQEVKSCKDCAKIQDCCSRFLCDDCCNGDKHTVKKLACGHLVCDDVEDHIEDDDADDEKICQRCQEIKNQHQEEAAWREYRVAIQQFLPSVKSKPAKMKSQASVAKKPERSDGVPKQDSPPSPPRSNHSDDLSSTKKRRKTSN